MASAAVHLKANMKPTSSWIKTFLKRYHKRFTIGIALLLFSIIPAIFAYYTPYFPGDIQITVFIQGFRSEFMTSLMEAVSSLFTGLPAILLVVVFVAVILWRLGMLAAIFMALAGALSPADDILKFIIRRPRPTANLVNIILTSPGLSFPSGHAFFTTMTLGMMIYFIIKYVPNRPLKVLLSSVLIFVILLVGYSRVYLGAHWSSDVVESYLIAGAAVMLLTVLYEQVLISRPGYIKTGILKNRGAEVQKHN
jgi:membrane-associated phospholipid phosphatase